jgi:hypothetical protein
VFPGAHVPCPVGNERGKDIALRIANHLLKTIIKEVR